MSDHLENMRNNRPDFEKSKLDDNKIEDPVLFFSEWYREAHDKKCADPHAFVLSTVNEANKPSSRVVYMRELVEEGIVFYTNYESKKGKSIAANPHVSALFYWDCYERQVRIEGEAVKVPEEMSDAYFANRPRISQIGAWASAQSQKVENRQELEVLVQKFEEKFPNEVPRPPHWGGYLIKPQYFEFWQGRLGRLHDRICFEKIESGWRHYRISP